MYILSKEIVTYPWILNLQGDTGTRKKGVCCCYTKEFPSWLCGQSLGVRFTKSAKKAVPPPSPLSRAGILERFTMGTKDGAFSTHKKRVELEVW